MALNSWGCSPLDQINRNNVGQLTLAWSRPLAAGIQEGTPLVYDGVMYFPNPLDIVQAINAASGDLMWELSTLVCPRLNKRRKTSSLNSDVTSSFAAGPRTNTSTRASAERRTTGRPSMP